MQVWVDILSFAVFTGFAFAALCAITRVGRGWPLQLLGLAALGVIDFLLELLWRTGRMPLDLWLSVCFAVKCGVIVVLVFALSRDSPGRRLFLSITYGAYAVCYAVFFHALTYRNVFGLHKEMVFVAGLVVVAALNLAFIFWILPQMPGDSRHYRWHVSCIVAGVVTASLFVSGVWPISVLTAPARYCSAFALASVVAWVAFPLLCRMMRERLFAVATDRRLELMMAEVKVRRSAIDLARRLRHDQRHHRAQIVEYMLSGQHEKVLDYLRQLDEEAEEAPTDKLVWCGNETVNAILSGVSRKAAAKRVSFAAEVRVERDIALPDVELVAVLANLIENALEAAAGQHKREPVRLSSPSTLDFDSSPQVTCILRQREFGLGITVTNTVPKDFALSDRGLPCAEPGVGLESVRRVVERHNGQWTYELKDGVLKCQVILMELSPGSTHNKRKGT